MSKAEKTKQFIIEQAAPVFMTRGIAGTSVTDLMQVTKMSKGSLYVHFANKEELAVSVAAYNLELFVAKCLEAVQEFKTPKERMIGMLEFLSDPLHPPVAGGCPMMNFAMEADDTDPVILGKVAKTISDVQSFFSITVEEGIQEGQFKKTWDAKIFAIKAYAMMEGGILISRASQNIDQMGILIGLIKAEVEENSL
ncbi:TetR/AcrR family transcriptional regulator [Mucilaginibacter polytrichastri]|uniref:HTH tetR-type domain-containing protein n=1 Tax=Mucilaginibacter polytrichastri TaxID=1302689 RepID=A0A1Q5ZY59_9SPHI|nr:TetR/AcrR family transcriptional regulator [Mucilaginibacter polytrichastri]OKS86678.1 hypothetical protein RG47T_2135 [Mucilaginibacter polytrichastri]